MNNSFPFVEGELSEVDDIELEDRECEEGEGGADPEGIYFNKNLTADRF